MLPHLFFIVLLLICSTTFIYYIYHYSKKYFGRKKELAWLKDPIILHNKKIIAALYQGVNATDLSVTERQQRGSADYSLVYGEVPFLSFAAILQVVEPQPGEVFYDQGSGAGLAVFSAALLYDLQKSCGIEILSSLHEQSISLQKLLSETSCNQPHVATKNHCIEFINVDLFHYDFSDADIVFINATGFFGDNWQQLVEQLQQLKPGCRIIISSKQLPESCFQLIDYRLRPMSWGMCRVSIYMRI